MGGLNLGDAEGQHAALDNPVPGGRVPELDEDVLEAGAAALDRGNVGLDRIAVELEAGGRRDHVAVGVLEVAESDDVAVTLGQVLADPDDQVGVPWGCRVRVDLGPDQLALARGSVDQDDRLAGVEAAVHVNDGHRAGLVHRLLGFEPRNVGDDARPGAEAVTAGVARVGGRRRGVWSPVLRI